MNNNLDVISYFRERVYHYAKTNPDSLAFSFYELDDTSSITYGQLNQRAETIAAYLQARCKVGERALLVYPPGLDFIASMLACLYSGIIAVPTYPPLNKKLITKTIKIIKDARPSVVLSTSPITKKIKQIKLIQKVGRFIPNKELMHVDAAELINVDGARLDWVSTDELPSNPFVEIKLSKDAIAYLQYTSGSTGSPKGVMVTHENLVKNIQIIHGAFDVSVDSSGISWLPPYHDMGLIGYILNPMLLGVHSRLMSPLAFLRNPFFWLDKISKCRATTNGGPNFGYDYCVKRITEQQKAKLDLSCWEVAYCGAEPIFKATLDRFAAAFQDCGFNPSAFKTCYGLAEATLCVSVAKDKGIHFLMADENDLKLNKISQPKNSADSVTLVSSGVPKQDVTIVNPDSLEACRENEVGEIWVTGPCVAAGYWEKPEVTKEIFQAHLKQDLNTNYLRTGDLGFMHEGELYVTGRIKDLIVIRGKNYYPQDLEQTVGGSHPEVRQGGVAAFAVTQNEEEKIYIVCEVQAREEYLKIIHAITQNLAEEHQVAAYTIALIDPKTLPKTTSGKVQRYLAKEMLLQNQLALRYLWVADRISPDVSKAEREVVFKRRDEITTWLVNWVAKRANIPAEKVNIDGAFTEFGIDSIAVIELVSDLEKYLGTKIDINDFWDFPTINLLAKAISEKQKLHTSEQAVDYSATVGPKGVYLKRGDHIGVLIVHGLSGTPGEMLEFASSLAQENITVAVPQIAGHASSLEDFKASNRQAWLNSIMPTFNLLKESCTHIYLAGLSAGGLLALQAGLKQKDVSIAGMILLSPFFFFDGWNIAKVRMKLVMPLVLHTPLRYLVSFKEKYPYGIKDDAIRSNLEKVLNNQSEEFADMVGHMKLPAVFFYEVDSLVKDTIKILPNISCPLLVIHSVEDEIASINNVRFLVSKVGSKQIDVRYLDDCYHLITLDRKKDTVIQLVLSYLLKNHPNLV
jgi:acyl-CoA synthetase (AMP-forming)/AMP-acid ligase II/esterase/lipase/acyl carrier protein